jgi:hypothetical protein
MQTTTARTALFNLAQASYDNAEDLCSDAVSERAEAISTAPSLEQMADALATLGTTKAGLLALRDAWMNGNGAFMREVVDQLAAGFADIAETAALECDGFEVLSDW